MVAEYQGDLFFNDLGQGIVRNVSFDAFGNITDVDIFTTGALLWSPCPRDPTAALYYVDLNTERLVAGNWFDQSAKRVDR